MAASKIIVPLVVAVAAGAVEYYGRLRDRSARTQILRALVVAALLIASPGFAEAKRPMPLTEDEQVVVQVYEAPGFTKDQLFAASRIWIAENFKSAKAVIEYENKDEGTIIGNGNMLYPCGGAFSCMIKSDWRVPFTMKVETKDGKIRLTFTKIHLAWPAHYSAGITTPASDIPVRQREDMDKIKPELLKFGAEIVASVGKQKADENW